MSEIAIVNFISSNAIAINLDNFVTLGSYKNSFSKKHNVTLLNNSVLLIGDNSKSILHVYNLSKLEDNLQSKIILSLKPSSLCASNDGSFVIIAAENDILVWQPASNLFVKCRKIHYQPVTVLRFSRDGSYFVSGGEDGLVVVWNISKVLSSCSQSIGSCETIFSDHQLPITDLNISQELTSVYLLSTSKDRTCRIYDINAKVTVLKIVFESMLSVGVFDSIKSCVYLGDINGNIFNLNLTTSNIKQVEHFEERFSDLHKFSAVHNKEITCIVVTTDNKRIITGSLDKLIVVWNSHGVSLKILPQNSEISSIIITQFDLYNINHKRTNNSIKRFNRIKCDYSNKFFEIQLQKSYFNQKYLIKNLQESARNSRLESESTSVKHFNTSLFEFCKNVLEKE